MLLERPKGKPVEIPAPGRGSRGAYARHGQAATQVSPQTLGGVRARVISLVKRSCPRKWINQRRGRWPSKVSPHTEASRALRSALENAGEATELPARSYP